MARCLVAEWVPQMVGTWVVQKDLQKAVHWVVQLAAPTADPTADRKAGLLADQLVRCSAEQWVDQ
jgi:hypothetical protein